jgi:Spy/CpxP family protein refolding chaperone
MKIKSTLFLTTAALVMSAALAQAQAPAPQGGDPNARGGGRGGNFEEFRQRMAERLKTSLKVSNEEWAVLQPLIEKVQTKQRDAMGGRGFGGPGGGGGRGGNGGGPGGGGNGGGGPGGAPGGGADRPGAAERDALRTAVENESSTPEELKAKLAALRDSRKKATAELEAAREELKKVLTVRQEAALVSAGILE